MQQQIGQRIKALRTERGYTQVQLAEKIGTQQPHIFRIENGEENLSLETLERLAKALDCKLEILFTART